MLTPKQLATLRRSPLTGRNKVALAMELAEVTQVVLAAALKTQQPHVSAVATGRYGRNGLPLETTRKFAAYFGCAIEDLFPAGREMRRRISREVTA